MSGTVQAVTVHRCLRYRAPRYLTDCCVPVSEVSGCQHLRSASRRKLNIPRFRRSTFGSRASSVAGLTVWNSLPDSLRDPAVESERFRQDLKTHLFAVHWNRNALEVSPFHGIALYKSTFTFLTFTRHIFRQPELFETDCGYV